MVDNQSVVEPMQLLPAALSTEAVSPQTNLAQLSFVGVGMVLTDIDHVMTKKR